MRLTVWAPLAKTIAVQVVDGPAIPLDPDPARPGWYVADVAELEHGVDYLILLDDEPLPDPRARQLPSGVHGPARVWEATRFAWTDDGWAGRPLARASLVYELHVGTFTTVGTLDAAAGRLDHLLELGVTHVELMPLAAFDGTRGWGYDGVTLESVHVPYGGPDALCRFVDAAHARGLAVLLDVVHNHLGPSGNYWQQFGPFMTDRHRTPWGDAVNLDAEGSDDVRTILLGSSTGLLRDFHLDGLRLDAVHEFRDDRARTYLEELADTVAALSVELGRPLALVAESDRNDPRTITPTATGGLGMTAQWADDVHHALHWLLTGESQGYYADFASCEAVAHTLEHGFHHDGRWSSFRGRTHGRPIDWSATDPWRLVVALQTHDQVGNRARGERLSALVPQDRLAAGIALLLALPYTPMLFMGEEFAAGSPWRFFTSFPGEELGEAVTEGRQQEYEAHGWVATDVPHPQAPETYWVSKLDWREADSPGHEELGSWYRSLVELRELEPGFGPGVARSEATTADGLTCSWALLPDGSPDGSPDGRPCWFMVARGQWRTVTNLGIGGSAGPDEVTLDLGSGAQIQLAWGDGIELTEAGLRLPAGSTAVVRVAAPAEPTEPGVPLRRWWRKAARPTVPTRLAEPAGRSRTFPDRDPAAPGS